MTEDGLSSLAKVAEAFDDGALTEVLVLARDSTGEIHSMDSGLTLREAGDLLGEMWQELGMMDIRWARMTRERRRCRSIRRTG